MQHVASKCTCTLHTHTATRCNTSHAQYNTTATQLHHNCVTTASQLQNTASSCAGTLNAHTTSRCNTLQHAATHYKHTATHYNTLHHAATHYNTLQQTTTRCNTLQHAATHYKHTATHYDTTATHSILMCMHTPKLPAITLKSNQIMYSKHKKIRVRQLGGWQRGRISVLPWQMGGWFHLARIRSGN